MEPLKLIKHAMDATIAKVANGSHPTDALEKTARNLALNPNYTQRVGEALNVALHFNHFSSTSGEKRAADFPVADIPAVLKSIFGEKEKTAAQLRSEWFPEVGEQIDYNLYLTSKSFQKTASQFRSLEEAPKGPSLATLYKQAGDYVAKLEAELEKLAVEKVSNDSYLEAVFNSTVSYFKKTAAARQPFHELETQAFSAFGERAVPYLDLIYKAANLTEPRGTHDTGAINFSTGRAFELFDSLLKSASKCIDLKEKVAEAELNTGIQKALFKSAGYKLHPAWGETEKAAADALSEDLDKIIEKIAATGIKDSLIMDLYNQLSDAAYDRDKPSVPFKNTKMDNLNKVTMLQELVMTDPILRHQPPQKVLQAYQTMLRMAPHLAADKEVTRALLRQLTATQSIAPTEANQWIEANSNLMKQHQMLHTTTPKKDKK